MALVLWPLVPLMSDQAVNILSPAGGPGPEAGTVPTPCLWGGVQSLAFLFEDVVIKATAFQIPFLEKTEEQRRFCSQVVPGNHSRLEFPICKVQTASSGCAGALTEARVGEERYFFQTVREVTGCSDGP